MLSALLPKNSVEKGEKTGEHGRTRKNRKEQWKKVKFKSLHRKCRKSYSLIASSASSFSITISTEWTPMHRVG